MYPVFLNLSGRPVLVVGAGNVARRRIELLREHGARLTVVAPDAGPELGVETFHRREFEPSDVHGMWLVQSCAGAAVDARVGAACDAERIWCVQASDAEVSRAWTGTRVAGPDGVSVAISGGGDPRRAQSLRRVIEAALTSADLRRHRPGTGKVILVGAGPGDPGLLTVRAAQALAAADVVVADRLTPRAALEGLAAEILHVGKAPGAHSVRQDEINDLLVERAGAGDVVVRFKGGDPFVLGRGGEELQACIAAGIDVEVVPGITSAISVPAAAGIPVTHRGAALGFLVATAHGEDDSLIGRLARTPPEITLVLLMGVRQLASVTQALIAAGRDPRTPAAAIERGWTPLQRTVTSTLQDLASDCERAAIASPSTVVIGDVVALREELGDVGRPDSHAGLVADARLD